MAKKEEAGRLPRPKPELPPLINKPSGGKTLLIVSGDADVKSSDSQVTIERKS